MELILIDIFLLGGLAVLTTTAFVHILRKEIKKAKYGKSIIFGEKRK